MNPNFFNDASPPGVNKIAEKEMAIRKAGTQIGVTLEVNHLDNTFTVILTPDETQQLIQSLLKER